MEKEAGESSRWLCFSYLRRIRWASTSPCFDITREFCRGNRNTFWLLRVQQIHLFLHSPPRTPSNAPESTSPPHLPGVSTIQWVLQWLWTKLVSTECVSCHDRYRCRIWFDVDELLESFSAGFQHYSRPLVSRQWHDTDSQSHSW